ncbi:MAG TPA: cytochrome b N-terminal domain-containing protein [Vicinamibacterales bacterium]|nr:cytochrome b N-terminal domain-containing protein [Vicinamibacterales bacterium]
MLHALLTWLDSRTGYRSLLSRALDEPLPPGTGWAFTTGSVVALLVGCQFLTGVGLSMYYVPSPSLAYDSLRFLMTEIPLGGLMRGLHFWGASFIVVAATVHLVRVFLFGAYKAPREMTWITGLVLLLLILGFSLSGYLLPWDQKAYWATTVTISVAESTPVIGGFVAAILRGGSELGALTLGRWYSAHVFLLPGALVLFLIAHIALMRRHGISGPITPQAGPPVVFFPYHVVKDTVLMAAVFAALFTAAVYLPAHLDEIANPADADYIPRPEWYFLSLFQMLKYFPGPLEIVASQVVPGLVVGGMFALPFLDRGASRHPWAPSRRVFTLTVAAVFTGIVTLTWLGLRDAPTRFDPNQWGPQAVAGFLIAEGDQAPCARCHVEGGPASPVDATRISRDDGWLAFHMSDPETIAPGARPVDASFAPMLDDDQARAVLAFLRRTRAGGVPPTVTSSMASVIGTLGTRCVACHMIDGDGGDTGPTLTKIGARRDAAAIRRIINDPIDEYGDSVMPAYGRRLSAADIAALADYLAARK